MGFLDKIKNLKTEPNNKTDEAKTAGGVVLKKKADQAAEISSVGQKKKKTEIGQNQLNKVGVLVRHLMTEKTTRLAEKNQYVFAVSSQANKIAIAQAVKNRYGVTPIKINTVNVLGKTVRYGRSSGKTKSWKKAIVTLPPGQSIKTQEPV